MPQPKLSASPDAEGAEKFGGNLLFAWPAILFFIYVLAAIFIIYHDNGRLGSNEDVMFAIGGPIFVYIISGLQLYYFKVSDTQLIIKNYLFFWYTRTYEKTEINNISFGRPYRGALTLRVYIGNSSMKSYGAGSLSAKTWDVLKERLIQDGVAFDVNK